jgi:hypothetical protein
MTGDSKKVLANVLFGIGMSSASALRNVDSRRLKSRAKDLQIAGRVIRRLMESCQDYHIGNLNPSASSGSF